MINDIQAQRHVIGEGNIHINRQQRKKSKCLMSYACKF